MHVCRRRQRRQRRRMLEQRDQAPHDQQHHHDRGDLHDLHGAFAGFVNALGVLPPEVEGHENGEGCGEGVIRDRNLVAEMVEGVGQQAGKIQTGGDGAYRAGEDVIEEQSGDREFGQLSAHRFFHHAIDAAAHEHRTRLDVDGADRVAEQHHRQHEPRSALADDFLCVAPNVVRRRRQVGQYDCRRPPERDERQHH